MNPKANRLLSILTALAMILAALPAGASAASPVPDGTVPELVKVNMGKVSGIPLSVSPDGSTFLFGSENGPFLLRNGTEIPLKLAPDRGAGDPYGNFEKIIFTIMNVLPGEEGIRWSPDGRYAVLTARKLVLTNSPRLGLILLDAENGEIFQALATPQKMNAEGAVTVVSARFDSTGRYIYYFAYATGEGRNLYRYDLSSGKTEIITREVPPGLWTDLVEAADGSWLVTGQVSQGPLDVLFVSVPPEASGDPKAGLPLAMGSVHRVDGRTIYSSGLTGITWSRRQIVYSPVSGYGMIRGNTPLALTDENAEKAILIKFIMAFSLNRITPREGIFLDEYWILRDSAGDFRNVEAIPVDNGIIQTISDASSSGNLSEKDLNTLNAYADEIGLSRCLDVAGMCMSPDGRKILLSAGREGSYRLMLLDPETMRIFPVQAPEGLGYAAYDPPARTGYRPGMEWFTEDILLISNEKTGLPELYWFQIR